MFYILASQNNFLRDNIFTLQVITLEWKIKNRYLRMNFSWPVCFWWFVSSTNGSNLSLIKNWLTCVLWNRTSNFFQLWRGFERAKRGKNQKLMKLNKYLYRFAEYGGLSSSSWGTKPDWSVRRKTDFEKRICKCKNELDSTSCKMF